MGSSPKTLVIIPTRNEGDNILRLLDALFCLEPPVSVLVVDGRSTDGTPERVEERRRACDRLYLLTRGGQEGLGDAYRDGFRFALERGFDAVVQMDADHSHDPRCIPAMLARLDSADVVVGSRYVAGGRAEGISWGRRVLSRFGNAYARAMLRLRVCDATSGFKCFSRQALERVNVGTTGSRGFVFQVEVAARTAARGLRVVEMPIVFRGRRRERSKFSSQILREAFGRVAVWAWRGLEGRGPA